MSEPNDNLSPEILRVESFDHMFEALNRSEVKAAISTAAVFEHQDAIEAFNRTERDVYVVIGSPLEDFQEKLNRQLEKKGLNNSTVRTAFVEHVHALARNFLKNKNTRDDKWDVTITSTFLHNTRQREWHIDSYDATGTTYQMTTTLAGEPGTLVSHSKDYNRKAFERLRDERREKEIWYQKEMIRLRDEVRNPVKRKLSAKVIETQVKRARKKMVLDMEKLLANMEGHSTKGRDVVLFRGGDVPHSSPVLDRRRLVFTMVEFDEFMDLEHASRSY